MPYTQAYPLRGSVDTALQAKIDLLKKRGREGSDVATYYFTNRTPWITMTSAVDVVGEDERSSLKVSQASQLAKDYVLTSRYEKDGLPSGHSNTEQLGIRPRPGIQNMSITSHNQFGSLRTAKVSFQVWSKEDLDACEVLYMRPGMSVLLEWGWSLYLKKEGEDIRVHQMEEGYDIFKTTQRTLLGMLKALEALKTQRGYGYDAVFGFVKNFSWKLRPDGGYDCSTDIVSPGELVESLNVSRPIADNDSDLYKQYFDILADKKDRAAENAPEPTSVQIQSPTAGAAYQSIEKNIAAYARANEYKKYLTKIALDFRKEILSFQEQTSIYAILYWDFLITAKQRLLDEFGVEIQDEVGMYRLHFSDLPDEAYLAKRLYTTSKHQDDYQNLLLVNWSDPTYALDADGNRIVIKQGQTETFETKKAINPQYYVKLGYIFELLNEFFVKSGDETIVAFDTVGRTTFSQTQEFMAGLDPSVCLLPGDFSNMQINHTLKELASPENWTPYTPTTEVSTVFGPPQPPEEEVEEDIDDTNSILQTYVNVGLILQLLDDNQISTTTKSGVPVAKMFSFVKGILSGINNACAGLCELDIQYYEHEGLYAVIDRRNFATTKKAPTFLDMLGLGSLFYGHSVSSALTPALASSIAISAQANISSTDSTSAGFLRFNHGLQDRVLKDRQLVSSVVNPDKIYTSGQEDKQRIRELYGTLYGSLAWADDSFRSARELYHEYINEHYVKNKDTVFSRVVIPFVAQFEIDGTSGFRILNSFRVSEELLPYSYNYIKGGIGMVATGLEATVDSSKWVTRIKAHMYPLASGTLPVSSSFNTVRAQDDLENNIIVEYSDAVQDVDVLKYLRGGAIMSEHLPTFEDRKPLYDIVDDEYGKWDRGERNEITDRGGQDVTSPPNQFESNQMRYWLNLGWSWSQWMNQTTIENGVTSTNTGQTEAWSSAYISYIVNNGKTGLNDSTFTKTASHWKYVQSALNNRKAGKSYNGWVMFSLEHDRAKYPIVAEVGDILVNPSTRGRFNSHGDIVFYVKPPKFTVGVFDNIQMDEEMQFREDYAEAVCAGGNLSNTNKIVSFRLEKKVINGVVRYCYPASVADGSKLVVLKRY